MKNDSLAGVWLLMTIVGHAQSIDPWAREGPIDVDSVTVSMKAFRVSLIQQAKLIGFVFEEAGELFDPARSSRMPPSDRETGALQQPLRIRNESPRGNLATRCRVRGAMSLR